MKRLALLLPALVLPFAAGAQDATSMTPGQTMQLRCAAAFAIVAGDQARGDPAALAYPPLKERGREYFVQVGAQLMDALHLTREQVADRVQAEVAAQRRAKAAAADPKAYTHGLMQPCLAGLEASGL